MTATNDSRLLLQQAVAAAQQAELKADMLSRNNAETSVAWSQVSGAWTAAGRLALALQLNDLANDVIDPPRNGDTDGEDWMYLTKDERDTIEAWRANGQPPRSREKASPGEETQVIVPVNLGKTSVFNNVDILAAALARVATPSSARIMVPVTEVLHFDVERNILPHRQHDKDYFLVYPYARGN